MGKSYLFHEEKINFNVILLGGRANKMLVIDNNEPLCHCCQLLYTRVSICTIYAICSVSTNAWSLAMTVQKNKKLGFYILNLLINIHVSRIIYIYIICKEKKIFSAIIFHPNLNIPRAPNVIFQFTKELVLHQELEYTTLGEKAIPYYCS